MGGLREKRIGWGMRGVESEEWGSGDEGVGDSSEIGSIMK